MKKAIFYSSIGGILEFYDFIIFAIFSSAITHNFFPSTSEAAGLLLTLSVFAAGYLVRPVGGVIYGHFGDKYGRKSTFTFSVIIMALSTLCIALVPGYATLGIAAPILLTLFRLLQGASIGGEIPGAITFISETAVKIKTLACAVVFLGLVLGILLGEVVNISLSAFFSEQEMLNYGWRFAFIIGGLLGLWGFYLRRKLVETPFFQSVEQSKVKVPFITVIKKHPLAVLSGWALLGLVSSGIMVLFLIMPSYKNIAGLSDDITSSINTTILLIVTIASLVFGYFGDKINKKYLLLFAGIVAICFSYPTFHYLTQPGQTQLFYYTLFALFSYGIAVATVPAILAESFPTEVRYTGVALVYNLSFATTGGLAPVIIFALINLTGNILMPAYFFMAVAVIGLMGLLFYPKNNFK